MTKLGAVALSLDSCTLAVIRIRNSWVCINSCIESFKIIKVIVIVDVWKLPILLPTS